MSNLRLSSLMLICSLQLRLSLRIYMFAVPQRTPLLDNVTARIKGLTADLDKYAAETQLMARMDVLERREKEEKRQAELQPEVQVWLRTARAPQHWQSL